MTDVHVHHVSGSAMTCVLLRLACLFVYCSSAANSIPVANISEAVKEIGDNPTSAEVTLMPGLHPFDVISLSSHVTYDFHGYDGASGQDDVLLQPTSNSSSFILNRCNNVTFSNFSVLSNISGALFSIDESKNVTFKRIVLLEIDSQSNPVFVRNSLFVRIEQCNFQGSDKAVSSKFNQRTGLVIWFENMPPFLNSKNDIAVNVFKCHFINFYSEFPSVTEVLIAPTTRVATGAVEIHVIGVSSSHLNVAINATTFENVQVPLFTPFHLHFLNGSSNNSVLITHTDFTNCVGKSGGAMLIDFSRQATNNSVTITSSSFTNVFAFVEGAAVSGNYLDSSDNTITFEYCHFMNVYTAEVMLDGATLLFYSNRRPPHGTTTHSLYDVLIRNCQFGKNSTSDGLVIAKSVRILYESTNDTYGQGSVFQLYSSHVEVKGFLKVVTTSANRGGFISLYDRSSVNLVEASQLLLINNSAYESGGVIYSDPSNGQTFVEWINSHIGISKERSCFLFSGLQRSKINVKEQQIQFASPSDYPTRNTKIFFQSNKAFTNGMDISDSSFFRCPSLHRSCELLNAITQTTLEPLTPNSLLQRFLDVVGAKPITQSLSKCFTVSQLLFTHSIKSRVSTRTNWIFFAYASCSCLKPIPSTNDSSWQFRESCDATTIVSAVNETMAAILMNASIVSSDSNSIKLSVEFPFPPVPMFYVPWSHSWIANLIEQSKSAQPNIRRYVVSPSDLILTPAPGQAFSLNIAGYDQFLRQVNGSVASLSLLPDISSEISPPLALLRQGHKQYRRSDYIPFVLNEPIADLAILGIVNTTGYLWITADTIFPDATMELKLRFQLAPCHLGYMQKKDNTTRLEEYISNFKTKIIIEDSADDDFLTCQCIESSAIIYCDPSYKRNVLVAAGMWVGDINDREEKSWISRHEPVVNGTTEQLMGPANRRKFGWGRCVLDYCNHQVISGNWTINDINPCRNNRTGAICSVCEDGLTVTPLNSICQDCRGSKGSVGVFLNIMVTIVVILFFLFAAMVTDISTSTTFNTMLFNYQVTPYLLAEGTDAATFCSRLEVFYFSFCFTNNFHTINQLATHSVFTAALLVIVFVIIWCSNHKPFGGRLSRPLKALVVALSVTYVTFVSSGMDLLRSNRLFNSDSPDGDLVLFINASTPYASLPHIALVPLGGLTLLAAAILPVLAVWFRNHGGVIKPLSDIYTSYYDDRYRWWVGVDLGRRFVIALLAVSIGMAPVEDIVFVRQNSLMFAVTLLTVVHAIFQPFRDNFSNNFESLLLMNMCLLTGLSIQPPSTILTISLGVLIVWPYVAGGAILIYSNRKLVANLVTALREKSIKKKSTKAAAPLLKTTADDDSYSDD